MVSAEHRERHTAELLTSGSGELDALLGGGIDRGSSVLMMGPAGIGKSTVATSFLVANARRGDKGIICTFDESIGTIVQRAKGLGIGLDEHVKAGRIGLRKVDPAEFTPGEFADMLVSGVREQGVTMVSIDGLNGYLNAMPREEHLMLHLHEILSILNSLGATVFLTVAQQGVIGTMSQPVDVSYLADTVLLFRYYEHAGEVRQAVSAFKRRGGAHERTIRELRLDAGVRVGEPLTNFQGVLTGTPTFVGDTDALLRPKE